MNEQSPIIFCHYGNSAYLQYSFQSARLFNPDKRIILLGDESNKKVALKNNIEHVNFSECINTEEWEKFSRVYKHIAGAKHGRESWTRFVFERWFHIHAFLKKENINSFWHFDSDTLILTDLAQQEPKYQNYDCTEQCNYVCMGGFISSFNTVDGYVKKINELFQNEDYLNELRKQFLIHPGYAFTEMRAYETYRQQSGIKSIRLHTIINNETFDDCLCNGQAMETYAEKIYGHTIKKLYYSQDGIFYCRQLPDNAIIKMNSLNMSWLPDYIYFRVLKKIKNKKAPAKGSSSSFEELKTLNMKPSLKNVLVNSVEKILKKIIR
jgi:hypothetical protein